MSGLKPAGDQYALIIGAMKSGTSALFDLLCQHPQVCGSMVKEPEYFSATQRHGMGIGNYCDLWKFDSHVHRVALEASTGYAKYPDEPGVPERIAATGIQPKFLYVLRDPIQRIYSHVTYSTWGRKDAVPDFTDPHALAISRYAMQLDRYTAVFPADRILLIDHGELGRNPTGVAAQVFGFLGVDPLQVHPQAHKNAARPRSDWERALLRSGRLAKLAGAAPPSMKAGLRWASGVGAPARPAIPDAVERDLRRALQPDMARLAREWGFDVSRWGFVGDGEREAS